ncbi:hypothetical protein [Holzapfeliella sp. JNUCC 72]
MYNKNKIQKTNEKKIMKKVKKQWVVASLATFALLGAGAISTVQTGSQQVMADGSGAEISSGSSLKNASDGYNDGIKTANSETVDTVYNDQSGDYKTAYDNAKQGYLDGWNYKDKSSGNSDYERAYDEAYNNSPIVQGANAGIEAAKINGNSTIENREQKDSYEKAYKGLIAGKVNNNGANSEINQDAIYQKGFAIGKNITAEKASQEKDGIAAGKAAAEEDALNMSKSYNLSDNSQKSRALPNSGSEEYRQAYQKAYDAVVLGTNNADSNSIEEKYRSAYDTGKSIRDNNQTVLVSNAEQLDASLKDQTIIGSGSEQKDRISNIKVVKDITMWSQRGRSGKQWDVSNGDIEVKKNILNFDGGGHTIDFANSKYVQKKAGGVVNIKNAKMYGIEYYGPISADIEVNVTYDNVSYVGPQLIESEKTTVYIKNKVEINSNNFNYEPKNIVVNTEDRVPESLYLELESAGASQENIRASKIYFEENSNFSGYTNNGSVLYLVNGPNVEIKPGATVNLYPKGDNALDYGLYMYGGNLLVSKDARLNIEPQKYNNEKLASALSLENKAKLIVDGGHFNVKMDGNLYNSNPINIGGDVVVQNNGKFIVEKTGGGNQGASLVSTSGGLTVKEKSSIGLYADGTANYTLLKTSGSGKIDIQNPSSDTYRLNNQEVSGIVFNLSNNEGERSAIATGSDINIQNITFGSDSTAYSNVIIPSSQDGLKTYQATNQDSESKDSELPNSYAQYGGASIKEKANKTRYLNFGVTPTFKFDDDSIKLVKDAKTGALKITGTYRLLDSLKDTSKKKFPIYLGATLNGQSVNATVKNTDYKLEDKNNIKYNQKINKPSVADDTPISFSILLPKDTQRSNIQSLSVNSQYFVGSDEYTLDMSRATVDTSESDIYDGASDYLNNRTNSGYQPNLTNENFKKGYESAKSGYEDALKQPAVNNNSSASDLTSYNRGYDKANASRNAENDGYHDALKNSNNQPEDEPEKSLYQKGHNRGEKVLAAILDATSSPVTNKQEGQGDIYEDAYAGARKAQDESYDIGSISLDSENYKAGFDNTKGIKDALGEEPNTINPDKDGVSDGYRLTAKGIQDAKNNSETSEFSNSAFYKSGKSEYQSGKDAFLAGQSDPKDDSSKTQTFKQAYQDAEDGYNQFNSNSSVDLNGKPQAFKDGYKTAQAIDDYLEGRGNQEPSNSAYNTAYTEAEKGAKTSNDAELVGKSQAFQKSYNSTKKQAEGADDFAKDSTKGMDAEKSKDSNYKAGFEGARDGQTDGAKDGYTGKAKTENELKQKPQAYIKSYLAASKAAFLARQGAIEALNENDQSKPENNNEAYKSGYEGAKDFIIRPSEGTKSTEANYQTGYNLARGISDRLANKATAVAGEPTNAYESGVKSVDDGQRDYQSVSKDTDRYTNDKAYQIGYDKAELAVKDYLAGESAKDNSQGIYKDAYDKAAAGYDNVNKSDNDSSVQQGNLSQAYKEARQAAKEQQAGADKYLADTTSAPGDSQASKDGFNGAKAGQQDGASGITKSESDLKADNKSKAYKDAYNKANQQAKEARDGAQDAIKNDSSKYNSGVTSAYNKGYEGAQKGLAKDTNNVSKDANTQTGYNLGQGTTDALASGVESTTSSSDQGYQSAYYAVKAGAKSYQAENTTDSDKDNTKKQYNDDSAYKAGYDTAKQAVDDFVDGKSQQKSDALYEEIYQNAVDGYNNVHRDDNKKKADYKAGQYSKALGTAGSDDYQKQSEKSDKYGKDKAYTNGHDGAQEGTKDGLAKAEKADLTGKSKAYKDAYNTAYPKAEEARKGAEAALENPNQTPNGNADFKSGFDGAKAGFSAPLESKATGQNAQYVAAYNRAQGIKAALANPTVELSGSDTHSESYKAGYRDTQSGMKASLSKDNKAVDVGQAYVKGYEAIAQGVESYQAGTTPMPTDKTKAYEKGYTEAQTGHDDALKSGLNKEDDLSGQSKQYQDSYKATKAALQGRDDYLNSRDRVNTSQYESNPTSQKGYDEAYTGSQDGVNDYNNGTVKTEFSGKSKAYQDAYNMIATSQKAMADAKVNQDKSNSYTGELKLNYQDAYKAAKEAVKSNSQKEVNASASYNYAYDSVKGASDYVNGQDKQETSKNYQESYEQADKGHDVYRDNPITDTTGKSQAFIEGFTSAQVGTEGSNAYQSQTVKESGKGQSYETGYEGAKQATEDALAKTPAKTDFSDKTPAYQDAYNIAYPKAEEARKGSEEALRNPNQTPNGNADFISGFDGAKAGFSAPLESKATGQNAQYVAVYDRYQGIKAALANPTVDLSETDTHSESYKAGYRDTQSGITASLSKDNKADDAGQAYTKGYEAIAQGVKAYQAGTTPMPTDKTKAYEKGYTEAQTGHDDALKSGLNKEDDLSGQSKQYQDSYKATKAALYGQKDYLNGRSQNNKNKYPDYQEFYTEGFEGAKAGQGSGLSGASANTKDKSAAYKVGYKFGYDSGYSSYLNNLGSGQLSGENDGENGRPLADLSMFGGTYSSSYMAAYKQAYDNYQNGIAQADKDLTNGVKVDLTGKSKAYINGYNSISANMEQTTVAHVPNEGVLIWDMVDGKPVQTTSYEHHKDSVRATKETKVVDGISYTKLANNRGWLQTKYLADPSSKAGVVNYISGYGVLVWNSDQNAMKSSEMTESSLANVKTYDEKVIDGISYTRINAKDSDQWVQTQYLKPAEPTPTTGVASVGNVPANHAIYLRDKNGNMTNQAIFANTAWKVVSQKRISGELYYCLGNDNQWIEAKYVTNLQ